MKLFLADPLSLALKNTIRGQEPLQNSGTVAL